MLELVTAHLLLLAALGLFGTVVPVFWDDLTDSASGIWRRLRTMTAVRRAIFGLGLVCMTIFGVGLVSVIHSTPGREETVIEIPRPLPAIVSLTLADKLHAKWDAYGAATWPVAEVMAEASRIAYLPPHTAEKEFHTLGFESVKLMSDGTMIGYVVTANDVAVVVFRGTDDPGDWLANLDRFVAKTPDGPAHRGFYAAYQRLSPQVAALVTASQVRSVWITGHSLGGALAVLCAHDLASNGTLELAGIMTFGQPMVAQSPLTTRIDQLLPAKYVHFANNRDIVPRVEPSFSHCGSLVYYDGEVVRRSKSHLMMGSASSPAETIDADAGFELEPLSEQEFRALQKHLREEQADPDFAPDGTPLMKGSSPLIRDHDMGLYLDQLRRSRARSGEAD